MRLFGINFGGEPGAENEQSRKPDEEGDDSNTDNHLRDQNRNELEPTEEERRQQRAAIIESYVDRMAGASDQDLEQYSGYREKPAGKRTENRLKDAATKLGLGLAGVSIAFLTGGVAAVVPAAASVVGGFAGSWAGGKIFDFFRKGSEDQEKAWIAELKALEADQLKALRNAALQYKKAQAVDRGEYQWKDNERPIGAKEAYAAFILQYVEVQNFQSRKDVAEIRSKLERSQKVGKWGRVASKIFGGLLAGGGIAALFRGHLTHLTQEAGTNLHDQGFGNAVTDHLGPDFGMQGHHVHQVGDRILFDYAHGEADQIQTALGQNAFTPEMINGVQAHSVVNEHTLAMFNKYVADHVGREMLGIGLGVGTAVTADAFLGEALQAPIQAEQRTRIIFTRIEPEEAKRITEEIDRTPSSGGTGGDGEGGKKSEPETDWPALNPDSEMGSEPDQTDWPAINPDDEMGTVPDETDWPKFKPEDELGITPEGEAGETTGEEDEERHEEETEGVESDEDRIHRERAEHAEQHGFAYMGDVAKEDDPEREESFISQLEESEKHPNDRRVVLGVARSVRWEIDEVKRDAEGKILVDLSLIRSEDFSRIQNDGARPRKINVKLEELVDERRGYYWFLEDEETRRTAPLRPQAKEGEIRPELPVGFEDGGSIAENMDRFMEDLSGDGRIIIANSGIRYEVVNADNNKVTARILNGKLEGDYWQEYEFVYESLADSRNGWVWYREITMQPRIDEDDVNQERGDEEQHLPGNPDLEPVDIEAAKKLEIPGFTNRGLVCETVDTLIEASRGDHRLMLVRGNSYYGVTTPIKNGELRLIPLDQNLYKIENHDRPANLSQFTSEGIGWVWFRKDTAEEVKDLPPVRPENKEDFELPEIVNLAEFKNMGGVGGRKGQRILNEEFKKALGELVRSKRQVLIQKDGVWWRLKPVRTRGGWEMYTGRGVAPMDIPEDEYNDGADDNGDTENLYRAERLELDETVPGGQTYRAGEENFFGHTEIAFDNWYWEMRDEQEDESPAPEQPPVKDENEDNLPPDVPGFEKHGLVSADFESFEKAINDPALAHNILLEYNGNFFGFEGLSEIEGEPGIRVTVLNPDLSIVLNKWGKPAWSNLSLTFMKGEKLPYHWYTREPQAEKTPVYLPSSEAKAPDAMESKGKISDSESSFVEAITSYKTKPNVMLEKGDERFGIQEVRGIGTEMRMTVNKLVIVDEKLRIAGDSAKYYVSDLVKPEEGWTWYQEKRDGTGMPAAGSGEPTRPVAGRVIPGEPLSLDAEAEQRVGQPFAPRHEIQRWHRAMLPYSGDVEDVLHQFDNFWKDNHLRIVLRTKAALAVFMSLDEYREDTGEFVCTVLDYNNRTSSDVNYTADRRILTRQQVADEIGSLYLEGYNVKGEFVPGRAPAPAAGPKPAEGQEPIDTGGSTSNVGEALRRKAEELARRGLVEGGVEQQADIKEEQYVEKGKIGSDNIEELKQKISSSDWKGVRIREGEDGIVYRPKERLKKGVDKIVLKPVRTPHNNEIAAQRGELSELEMFEEALVRGDFYWLELDNSKPTDPVNEGAVSSDTNLGSGGVLTPGAGEGEQAAQGLAPGASLVHGTDGPDPEGTEPGLSTEVLDENGASLARVGLIRSDKIHKHISGWIEMGAQVYVRNSLTNELLKIVLPNESSYHLARVDQTNPGVVEIPKEQISSGGYELLTTPDFAAVMNDEERAAIEPDGQLV